MTYRQFAAMSRSLAAALDDLGVGEGERVGIVSPNAARFLVSLFGVSAWGRVLVPVNFRLNAEEIGYVVEHSGSTVLLVDPDLDAPLRHLRVKHRFVLGAETEELQAAAAEVERGELRVDEAPAERRVLELLVPTEGRARLLRAWRWRLARLREE